MYNRQQLPDNFPHRIGYACLNTILRKQNPSVFCSRTCRVATILSNGLDNGISHLKELGLQNLRDLEKMIRWNEANGIKFMRMSSDMFPFASHEYYGYSLEYCSEELARVGKIANELGHRLTTHPGQTNNLGSPSSNVVLCTKRDLYYHSSMMDLMGLGKDSVMIIHGGGVYNDKKTTMERWEKEFLSMKESVRARIVLENDEVCYSTEDLLPMCEKLDIPLVFDWHHHAINPGKIPLNDLLIRIKAIWKKRGIRQKMHYSESRDFVTLESSIADRRPHSDYVKDIPMCGADVDLMIEAKMKEQTLLHIHDKYKIPVRAEVLLPISPAVIKTRDKIIRKNTANRLAAGDR